jgi:dTDP-4-amino-4,6-dideoxygalactose transaminase
MVIAAGGKPIFCDVDPATCNIDYDEAQKLINDKTAGLLITHLHGLAADAPRFKRLCDDHKIFMVEDAAQALGARRDGRSVGTIGHAGILSFGRVKNVNAFFGGAILTSDDELASQIRHELDQLQPISVATLAKRISSCFVADVATAPGIFDLITFPLLRLGAMRGIESINKLVNTEDHPELVEKIPEKYRTRVLPVQARFVLAQLETAEDDTERRIKNARRYDAGLSNVHLLRLPPASDGREHAYLAYPVQLDNRMDFIRYLMRKGCDATIQHYQNAADLECFAEYYRDCPNARRTARQVVLLPTYPGFTDSSIDKIIRATKAYRTGATPSLWSEQGGS